MAATDNMIEYATAIAEKLGIDEPDFSSFRDTSNFISKNVETFHKIIRKEQFDETIAEYEQYNRALSEDFISLLEFAEGKCGVYCLWCNNLIVYVGKSIDLQQRVLTSLKERSRSCDIEEVSMIFTPTIADMHILEVFMITYYKPILNKDCTCDDEPTMFKPPFVSKDMTRIVKIYEEDEE